VVKAYEGLEKGRATHADLVGWEYVGEGANLAKVLTGQRQPSRGRLSPYGRLYGVPGGSPPFS
jgi:hypothetical protein